MKCIWFNILMNWHILKLIQSVKSYRGIDLKKSHHFHMQDYFWKVWQFLGPVHIGTKFPRRRGSIVHLKENKRVGTQLQERAPFLQVERLTGFNSPFKCFPRPSMALCRVVIEHQPLHFCLNPSQ